MLAMHSMTPQLQAGEAASTAAEVKLCIYMHQQSQPAPHPNIPHLPFWNSAHLFAPMQLAVKQSSMSCAVTSPSSFHPSVTPALFTSSCNGAGGGPWGQKKRMQVAVGLWIA